MKKIYTYTFSFILCHLSFVLLSQNADSLNALITNAKHDTIRLRLLVEMCDQCEFSEMPNYAKPAIALADKLLEQDPTPTGILKNNILHFKAIALNNTGDFEIETGELIEALNYYKKSQAILEEINDTGSLPIVYLGIGGVYDRQGNILKALEYSNKALSIEQKEGNKIGIANALNNIALLFEQQGQYTEELAYLDKSLKLLEELNDKEGLANVLNNRAHLYYLLDKLPDALTDYNKSLKISEEIGYTLGIAQLMNNLGLVYRAMKDESKALEYYMKGLAISKGVNDKRGVAITYNNIGKVYFIQKKYQLAYRYQDSSLALAIEINSPYVRSGTEAALAKTDSALGNFKGAFDHYKQFIIYRDSLNNESTRKASVRSQLNYEFEKKEAVIKEQQDKERAIAEEKNRFQKIVIASVLMGLLLVIVFALFIFRSLKITRHQKHVIEEKQKEILDSIKYAKRIQTSLLPTEKYIDKYIKRS